MVAWPGGFCLQAPITAEEVKADVVVLTHEHADHLDPDAVPIITRNNRACRFTAPSGSMSALDEAGVAPAVRVTLETHQQYDLDGVVIHVAPARQSPCTAGRDPSASTAAMTRRRATLPPRLPAQRELIALALGCSP